MTETLDNMRELLAPLVVLVCGMLVLLLDLRRKAFVARKSLAGEAYRRSYVPWQIGSKTARPLRTSASRPYSSFNGRIRGSIWASPPGEYTTV